MWLEAIFSAQDLEHAVRALTPATLALGVHGTVYVDSPAHVELVAGRGLRAVCPAVVHGTLLGVEVPVKVAAATVLLEPAVVPRAGRDVLVFRITIESIDVSALPHIVEEAAVEAINAALVSHATELVWDFRRTLSHRFTLPDVVASVRWLDVAAAWGELRITKDALVVAVSIHAVSDGSNALLPVLASRKPHLKVVARRARARAVMVGLLAFSVSLAALLGAHVLARHARALR